MKIIYFILITFFLLSCNSHEVKDISVQFSKNFSIETPIEAGSMFSAYHINENLIYQTNSSNSIWIYSLDKMMLDSIVQVPEYILDQFNSLSINNFSSSIIINSEKRNGFFINNNGAWEFKKFQLDNHYIVENRKAVPVFISPDIFVMFVSMGDLSLYPENLLQSDLHNFLIYDLKENSVNSFFGEFPNYLIEARGHYPREFQTPFYLVHDNQLVVSYPLSEKLMVYDLDDQNKLFEFSSESSNFILPNPYSDRNNREEVFKLFYYANKFGPISYHDDLNIYSRVLIHEFQVTSTNACERKYSILFFDHDFKFIEEVELLSTKLGDWNYAVGTSNGFIVPGMCQDAAGEDYLIYNSVYKININKN